MVRSKDALEIFDNLESEQSQQQKQFRRLNETAATSDDHSGSKRFIVVLIIVLLLALGSWWVIHSLNNQQDTEASAASAAKTETSSPVLPSSSFSASYLNGEHPQAAEGRTALNPKAVEIPPATMPEIKVEDPESVMRAFITIVNNRNSSDLADFNRVKEWVAPYSSIEDMSGFDTYGTETTDLLPAPVTVEKIKVEASTENQMSNTSTRQSRVLETTVLASTGQKLRLKWEVTAMMDEKETWKVTEASLYNWQGIGR